MLNIRNRCINLLKSLTCISLFFFVFQSSAQVSINTDNSNPDPSAMLDVKSDTKGMLVPRMTTLQRTNINSPATGLLVFDTDTESFWFKNSTAWIELVDEASPFEYDAANNLVKPNEDVVDMVNDDFVFGSPQLDSTGNNDYRNRFFFDKSKGALRSGFTNTASWDDANRGNNSVAFGGRTTASGSNSAAFGDRSVASGSSATTFGDLNTASGSASAAFGAHNIASGSRSVTFGAYNTASGTRSATFGAYNTASGVRSVTFGAYNTASGARSATFGSYNRALSFAETALGSYNTLYIPTSAISWNTNDRLFSIGNGLSENSRSDAFSIMKNGNIALNGSVTIDSAFTFPIVDGMDRQVLQTDGNGNITWVNSVQNIIADSDNDTKIQVEESPDEDKIRFDLDGIESMRLEDNKLVIQPNYTGGLGSTLELEYREQNKVNRIISTIPNDAVNTPTNYELSLAPNGNATLVAKGDGQVQINNSYTLPTTDGSDGQVLVTDGNGQASWQSAGVPIGTIQMWATNTPPDGWLICNGNTFNASTYPQLNTILGGNTLPDFSGRFPLGAGNSGTAGSTNHTLNSTGGEEKHTLTIAEMPAHTHGIEYREGSEQGSGNDYSDLGDTGVTDSTQSTGGGNAHNNMPPFYTINFIIKAE